MDELYKEIILYAKTVFKLTIQLPDKDKVAKFFNEAITKKPIALDLTAKFNHPLVISENVIKIKNEELKASKSLTTTEKSKIWDPHSESFFDMKNKYISNKNLIGENKNQYMSEQNIFMSTEHYEFIKKDPATYSTKLLDAMGDFITKNGTTLKKELDEITHNFFRCINQFKDTNDNVGEHVIACSQLIKKIKKEKSETIYYDFYYEAQKYKEACARGIQIDYINNLDVIITKASEKIIESTNFLT